MRNFFKNIFIFLIVVFSIQSLLVELYQSITLSSSSCIEDSFYGETQEGGFITHNRSWKNNRSVSSFCMDYSIYENQWELSNELRESHEPDNDADFYYEYWGNIYKILHEMNKQDLEYIEDSLALIRDEKDLSQSEFAYLIVSFVQDIPYSYIMSEDCASMKDGKPCKGNAKFGILSPIEFLFTLSGDCDTRTVLLYSILNHFGYDPLILVSNQYLHSILAVNIPASGEYITHKGKKFYFWETTNTGWEPGMIAPDMKNKNYWNIALDYEY